MSLNYCINNTKYIYFLQVITFDCTYMLGRGKIVIWDKIFDDELQMNLCSSSTLNLTNHDEGKEYNWLRQMFFYILCTVLWSNLSEGLE